MGEERRRGKRIKESFSIICKIYKKTSLEGNLSKITDISTAGLCFILDKELTENNILHLIFRLPPGYKQRIELFGRIVGSQKTGNNKFKTRVAFIDISEKTRAILNRSVERPGFEGTIQKEE